MKWQSPVCARQKQMPEAFSASKHKVAFCHSITYTAPGERHKLFVLSLGWMFLLHSGVEFRSRSLSTSSGGRQASLTKGSFSDTCGAPVRRQSGPGDSSPLGTDCCVVVTTTLRPLRCSRPVCGTYLHLIC